MSEPVISDAEVDAFWEEHAAALADDATHATATHKALAAFLKGRVPPKAKTQFYGTNAQIKNGALVDEGFNACRDIVLRGGK